MSRGSASPWVRRGLYVALAAFPLIVIPASPLEPELVWSARDSSVSLAVTAAIFAVLAYSVAILLRCLDLASGAYAGLFAVGAYASGLAMERLDLGFWGALVLVVAVVAIIAVAAGALTLRSSGIAFMIATLAVGELLVLVIASWDGLPGGPLGLFSTKPAEVLPGVALDTPLSVYLVALAFLGVAVAVTAAVTGSRYGRRLQAIRDNEPFARSLGINAFTYKLSAFVIAAVLAGAAGHLFLIHLVAITPDLFRLVGLISIFLMVVMGGTYNLAGPAIGAWLVTFLPEWLGPLGLEDPTRQEFVFGGLLILFMLLAPIGIAGIAGRVLDRSSPARPRDTAAERLRPEPGEPVPVARRTNGARDGSAPLLQVEGLVRSFHAVRAVDGVSFDVRPGEVVGIIGPNGSGKTTLLNCVSGFLRADQGQVTWKGQDVSGERADKRARLGLVRTFQERTSMGAMSMTVRQHCELVSGPARPDVDELLRAFDLETARDTPASELSYGHLSTLALATALATGPELLMLDEPAAGLSSVERGQLRRQLLRLRDDGLTIIIVDHDMSFLMPMCDRIVVLDAGAKIADDAPDRIQRDPHVVAAYLGERFAERASSKLGTVR